MFLLFVCGELLGFAVACRGAAVAFCFFWDREERCFCFICWLEPAYIYIHMYTCYAVCGMSEYSLNGTYSSTYRQNLSILSTKVKSNNFLFLVRLRTAAIPSWRDRVSVAVCLCVCVDLLVQFHVQYECVPPVPVEEPYVLHAYTKTKSHMLDVCVYKYILSTIGINELPICMNI